MNRQSADKKRLVITIDGPAGAGKSTIAKLLAEHLKIRYLDTGAMYRALTWRALEEHIAIEDEAGLAALFGRTRMEVILAEQGQRILLDGVDATPYLRLQRVSELVSPLSAHGEIRKIMVEKQRAMAVEGGIVLDGRDIGTVVLPDAPLKIYLTASLEERTRRRLKDYAAQGIQMSFADLMQEIAARDQRDSSREHAPLLQAKDAVYLDSTALNQAQVVEMIEELCRQRGLCTEVSL